MYSDISKKTFKELTNEEVYQILDLRLKVFVMEQQIMYVDTDYILSNIPAYKEAQQQLDKLTKEWQTEIQQKVDNLDLMYKIHFQQQEVG